MPGYQLLYLVLAILVVLLIVGLMLYFLGRRLLRREPYSSFMRLSKGQKLTFLRLLLAEPRVPWVAKVLPILLVVYLVIPIDLIPDFIPVVGYLDDIAVAVVVLALLVKLTPQSVFSDLLIQAGEARRQAADRAPRSVQGDQATK